VRALLAGSLGLVAYVFAGYPAIMAALARLRPRPIRADAAFTPAVSLIIAAYDEADVIEAKLRDVAGLEYPPDRLEVIVAADGSEDDTAERARRFPGVRVLHEPERKGKAAAIERAAAMAAGDVLVFSDANNRYTRGALRALVAPLADPRVGLVGGRKAIEDGTGRSLDHAEGLYWRYESKLKAWEGAVGSVVGAPGEILAVRRTALPALKAGTVNEDFMQAVLVALAGWRVAYAPDAVSLERASATVEDEATRRSRLTAGRVQALHRLLAPLARRPGLACQVLSHKGLRPAVPWALAAAAWSAVALTRTWAPARWLAAGQAVFYGAALLGWRREKAGRRAGAAYLPFYFCRMNLATLDGLRDAALRRHSATWERVRRG
jgi:biofilm PGA synthesis N-glycosyltransferase PgaC